MQMSEIRQNAMVLLVGEQPAPNLLPVRHLEPDVAVLVYTDYTRRIAENLRRLLETSCRCLLHKVEAYDIPQARDSLARFLEDNVGGFSLTFNLTGGTKPMVLAAFELAHRRGAPFIYVETRRDRTVLYVYSISPQGVIELEKRESLGTTITVDDYLRAYVGEYDTAEGFASGEGGAFEKAVYTTLEPHVDEILPNVKVGGAIEIDLVIRQGNRIGIAEVKKGKAARKKRPIEQLATASAREFLGIHTRRFLILGTAWDENQESLRDLAKARDITVIELPSFGEKGSLSAEDRERLIERILKRL